MPRDTMTTKRMSFQQQALLQQQQQHQQQQQQQQRRPPDVEEALSSMLWTPYERASTTDTSSDEEDEEQLKCQLKKSKSQYDYTSVPTTIPPLTPPPPLASLPTSLCTLRPSSVQHSLPPAHATPANIVAYITTSPLAIPPAVATAATAATSLVSSTNAYYTAEDLCDPSVTTPLVPFSNLVLNATTPNNSRLQNAATSTTGYDNGGDLDHVNVEEHADADADADGDDDDDGDGGDVIFNTNDDFSDVFGNGNTFAATSSFPMMTMMMSSSKKKNRISYSSSYGRIPSLTKWWSTSSATSAPAITTPAAAAATLISSTSSTTTTQTEGTTKQPPSYESLYKKQTSRPLRQRHRLNKHLNLFKPVLDTLKANVTTITQTRFTALQRTDHNRVSNIQRTQPANVVRETALTTTTAGEVATDINCGTDSTSYNLVHSFTDNFLHEVSLSAEVMHVETCTFRFSN